MKFLKHTISVAAICVTGLTMSTQSTAQMALSEEPLFLNQNVPPLTLLVLGRDHKLYYEAYNDASDLNNDGVLDIRFTPDIDYYGYFDSYKCYLYDSTDGRFEPSQTTTDKTCSGSGEWSGNFLNYVTTARIDALRKVLYGGKRSTDTDSLTVLERSHIPQDAHAWGKEYTSTAVDGYDIADYTPLSQPISGTRHLFANVSLSNSGAPLMRVLNDSQFRVWEWLSKERPVAGTLCRDNSTNCEQTNVVSVPTNFEITPASALNGVTANFYDTSGSMPASPTTFAEYEAFQSNYEDVALLLATTSLTTINQTNVTVRDHFFTLITGQLEVPLGGEYEFGINGDDALEFAIDLNEDGNYTADEVVVDYYGAHGFNAMQTGTVELETGRTYNFRYRHQEVTGGEGYQLFWRYNDTAPASEITDYTVRIQVCASATLIEDNCALQGSGNYKPTGLLQDFGANNRMLFGLLSGSYDKNTSGGVLRQPIGSVASEFHSTSGVFDTGTNGVIANINRLQTRDFNYSNHAYGCGWDSAHRVINEGECVMWGNPIAEMMYEGLRYFTGTEAPLSAFEGQSGGHDDALGLGRPSWDDPYDNPYTGSDRAYCSKPFQLVISDINPSYDSDQLPGAIWGSFSAEASGPLSSMNVSSIGQTIANNETGFPGSYYIGQVDSTYDGTPTAKTVNSLGNIRGLAPEEPTKQGSYYSASVAHFGRINDLRSDQDGNQQMRTFAVALASPLPRIDIPIGNNTVTLIPFGKSVGGSSISPVQGDHQPTNQIVDFYVDTIVNTNTGNVDASVNGGRPYGKFRINFEDVEQGADHDMDAIVVYEFRVNSDNTVTINLDSTYAAGGIKQHLGYVISGTTADGTYLEVRDIPEDSNDNDNDYFLDTPPGESPGGAWNDGVSLPLSASRIFTPDSSATGAATILKDPLWYAAKWGGFEDSNGNDLPDLQSEWDEDGDGTPDNYFLVTNALTLKAQLQSAFQSILNQTSSASAVAANSSRLSTDTVIYQARFNPATWRGYLYAYAIDDQTGGIIRDGEGFPASETDDGDPDTYDQTAPWGTGENSDAGLKIPAAGSRSVFTWDGTQGISFAWGNLTATQKLLLQDGDSETVGQNRLSFIRGDHSQEARNGGPFRNRTDLEGNEFVLGDIINSDPVYVGSQNFGYDALSGTEGDAYETFRASSAYQNRSPIIYAGANDGMLHAFNATTGVEEFAYIPSILTHKLHELTEPSYAHTYFVDGTPWVGDAYIDITDDGTDNPEWKTILIGTLGTGGAGVFALDVTDPDNFNETDILWEFTDADLGFGVKQATIIRLENGQWAAVFGNGYNSANHRAMVYMVNLADGTLLKKFDTGVGDSSNPNGMGPVLAGDAEATLRSFDVLYAGDLQGNVWKIDISDSGNNAASQWDFGFKQGQDPEPLFQATDDDNNPQPITSIPNARKKPGGGIIVYVGTGKYLELSDRTDTSVQSFYGLYDDSNNNIGDRDTNLTEQTIIYEGTQAGGDFRVTSDNAIGNSRGWYIDLVYSGQELGERVVSDPQLRLGRVVFTTLVPDADPCVPGGTSWIMSLDTITGSRLDESVYDTDNQGGIDSGDLITVNINGQDVAVAASGRKSKVGIIKNPTVITAGNVNYTYESGTGGDDDDDNPPSCDPNDPDCVPPCDPNDPDCTPPPPPPCDNNGTLAVCPEEGDDSLGRQGWRQIQ